MSKNTFSKKRCHFWFWPISAETTIFIVFPGLHCFGAKIFWPKQIVCTKMRVFLPSLTQIVSGNFCKKKSSFYFSHFWMTTLKNTIFIWFFGLFHFPFFSFFCFYFSNLKRKNKKCNFLFENLTFDIPKILQKHYFGTM